MTTRSNSSRSGGPLAALLAALATLPLPAYSATFTWIGPDGSWQDAANWTPNLPPVFVPPPGTGDIANIVAPVLVKLHSDVQRLEALNLFGGAHVATNGNQLSVVNGDGSAETLVTDNGLASRRTELAVFATGDAPAFVGDVVQLSGGGLLRLLDDAHARIRRGLVIDEDSVLAGHGTIAFSNEFADDGDRRLDLYGTIRPSANGRIELAADLGSVDLDGAAEVNSLLDLSAARSGLFVNAPLRDAFGGRAVLGAYSQLIMQHEWTLADGPAGIGDGAHVAFDPGDGAPATVAGATWRIGRAGGAPVRVSALSGVGQVAADAILTPAANLAIAEGAALNFSGHVEYVGGSSIAGRGSFSPGIANYVRGEQLIDVRHIALDAGDWQIDAPLHLAAESLGRGAANLISDATMNVDGHDGRSGRLAVQLGPDQAWTLGDSASLNLLGDAADVRTMLDGSLLRIAGKVGVSGSVRTEAPLNLLGDGSIHIRPDSSLEMAADSRLLGGVVGGDGALRNSSVVVGGFGVVNAAVDFSREGVLRAAGGELVLNGPTLNLGKQVIVDEDAQLTVNQAAWDAGLAGEVLLLGGRLGGSAVILNRGGTIRGNGRVTAAGLVNDGLIAAGRGTLHIASPLDWDGSPSNRGVGVLEALEGDLLVTSQRTSGDPFFGTIRVQADRQLVYDTEGVATLWIGPDLGDATRPTGGGVVDMLGGKISADVINQQGRLH
ncbi:MAG: hypothetical protein KDA61_21110, partial [Planctomycetales bacterium]|nr:hypothetical protein [Planctomycetales bacterium]